MQHVFRVHYKRNTREQILPKYLRNKIIGVQRIDAGITSAINRTALYIILVVLLFLVLSNRERIGLKFVR